jgi:hypothetical protein
MFDYQQIAFVSNAFTTKSKGRVEDKSLIQRVIPRNSPCLHFIAAKYSSIEGSNLRESGG